jgi:hypothetical protein
MDDLRFRKIFNLGLTKDIFGKKLSKLEKVWLRNVVKYEKYSPAKLANLYTFLLRAEIGNSRRSF